MGRVSEPMSSEPQLSDSHAARARAERELEELVFECLERVERDGPTALNAICHEHAEHAPALLERVRALLESGLFDVGHVDLGAGEGGAPASAMAPNRALEIDDRGALGAPALPESERNVDTL